MDDYILVFKNDDRVYTVECSESEVQAIIDAEELGAGSVLVTIDDPEGD